MDWTYNQTTSKISFSFSTETIGFQQRYQLYQGPVSWKNTD